MSDDAIYSSCAGNSKLQNIGPAILRLLGLVLNGGMVMCSGRVGVEAYRSCVVWLERLGAAGGP